MVKLLKSESGAIISFVAAIIVAVVAVISAASLMAMVTSDQVQTQYAHDLIQEEILLRSENRRTHLSIEFNQNRPLPSRTIEINEPHRNTTYNITSSSSVQLISNFMGYATEQVVAVTSNITAKRGRGNSQISPIKRATSRYMRNESLAQYQYFTHIEASENEDGGTEAAAVKFWGPDEFHGKVHSNDDIWIQEAGAGNNGGWPTFYDMVTTAGEFLKYPTGINLEASGAPMDQIFQGGDPGWQEHVSGIVFSPDATEIQQNGWRAFENYDADIACVKLTGGGFESWVGEIVLEGYENFTVYSWYPQDENWVNAIISAGGNWFEDADSLWVNTVAIYDTVWTPGPSGAVNNRSVYVNDAELWIEGVVSGSQTWGCSEHIYITNDIYYANTEIGDAPDDEDNPNRSDYFGLVSEERLFIKYKHRDPFADFVIQDWNTDGIYMYGAYAAIGEGDVGLHGNMACHYDGIFTFEYQHPHGSTPNFTAASPYTLDDTNYTYIDLHKFIFPINHFVPPNIDGFNLHGNDPPDFFPCGYDYNYTTYFNSYPNASGGSPTYNYVEPYGTDYPWYNPVWPEDRTDIVYERGTIHLFGAIAQRRRGFVHRSGSDPYNHPNNEWDLDEFHYDGNHPSTGYAKDYHYDQRFLFVQPPDYPQIYNGQWGDENTLTAFDEETWFFVSPN